MRVSHFGKMGDLMYALPVLRALHRTSGEKVQLLTSGTCWQLAPLLWEQPYIADVELEDTKGHQTVEIERGAIFPHWRWYADGEGLNLSLQPAYFRDEAPVSWTRCYMEAAGVTELLPEDCVGLPSLINHRRWHHDITVESNGVPQPLSKTFIVAPEVETLQTADIGIWVRVIDALMNDGHVILVGRKRDHDVASALMVWRGKDAERLCDLRGLTTVPSMARLIAESAGFIGAHSFPWHVARHCEVPAVCLQSWREGLRRCLPIDTPYTWVEPLDWQKAVHFLMQPDLVLT